MRPAAAILTLSLLTAAAISCRARAADEPAHVRVVERVGVAMGS
jgi:hypothetical protein